MGSDTVTVVINVSFYPIYVLVTLFLLDLLAVVREEDWVWSGVLPGSHSGSGLHNNGKQPVHQDPPLPTNQQQNNLSICFVKLPRK